MHTATRARPRPVLHRDQWTLEQLQEHLQYAIDLELWTIPYYMSAMFSIKDPGTEATQLLRTVVNQEMLHMQLAANVANAYGVDVRIDPPVYGHGIPHLDFALDDPDPRVFFTPNSSRIGPFDETRLNTMCLIEFPDTNDRTSTDPDQDEYGSIGEFYASVSVGAEQLKHEIIGNRNQLDVFSRFYPGMAFSTVTRDGEYGWPQVDALVSTIVAQGEGGIDRRLRMHLAELSPGDRPFDTWIPAAMQNLADDLRPQADHFEKFFYLKGQDAPEVYELGQSTPAGVAAQARLVRNFAELCAILQSEFRGQGGEFSPLMFQIGGDMVSCWRHGVVPRFSDHDLCNDGSEELT